MRERVFKNVLVTGGAGFIGSFFIKHLLLKEGVLRVVNLDLLTYASSLKRVEEIKDDHRYTFVRGDINDRTLLEDILKRYKIDMVVHFAAETHVDNSIEDPERFLKSNICGTFNLLEVLKKIGGIHFHHISTDEVYGSRMDGYFDEDSKYMPSSPYSASKASSDLLVRAYVKTYNLSATISYCSNNYGPAQHREKLIPLIIERLLVGERVPIYGDGKNVRDWIYVEDHVEAIYLILKYGVPGEVYNIGSGYEVSNLALVYKIVERVCLVTGKGRGELEGLIGFVEDRKGHDFRYALDSSKIKRELSWRPKYSLKEGLKKTVCWHFKNLAKT